MAYQPYLTPRKNGANQDAKAPQRPFPQWCISHGDGTFTPVIAVDELPLGFNLKGVPRTLTVEEAREMDHIAQIPPPTARYEVEASPELFRRTRLKKPNHAVANAELPVNHSRAKSHLPPARSLPTPARSSDSSKVDVETQSEESNEDEADLLQALALRQHPKRYMNSFSAMPHSADGLFQPIGPLRRPPPPSGNEPNLAKKKYCTHWIRTGECDFQQQGCLYKHEMPDDITLARIGFRSVPKWWLEWQAELQQRKEWLHKLATEREAQAEGGAQSKALAPIGSERAAATNAAVGVQRGSGGHATKREQSSSSHVGHPRSGLLGLANNIHSQNLAIPVAPPAASTTQASEDHRVSTPLLIDFPPLEPSSSSATYKPAPIADTVAETILNVPAMGSLQSSTFKDSGDVGKTPFNSPRLNLMNHKAATSLYLDADRASINASPSTCVPMKPKRHRHVRNDPSVQANPAQLHKQLFVSKPTTGLHGEAAETAHARMARDVAGSKSLRHDRDKLPNNPKEQRHEQNKTVATSASHGGHDSFSSMSLGSAARGDEACGRGERKVRASRRKRRSERKMAARCSGEVQSLDSSPVVVGEDR